MLRFQIGGYREIHREAGVSDETLLQDRTSKQVIVMRHDLSMRRGKQIAQGAHAIDIMLDTSVGKFGPSQVIFCR